MVYPILIKIYMKETIYMNAITNCNLCPRRCGIDRTTNIGYCGTTDKVLLAKVMLHKWEEPCISVTNGAGTVFFSGCNLHCCYCQNNAISNEIYGKSVTIEQLANIFLSLQEQGADNIELITPTHYVTQIIKALDIAKPHLHIPIVYNTGGYELSETIKLLNDYIDVYIPDLKYFSQEASLRYSHAADYFKYASESILQMISQAGKLVYNTNGGLIKGTIIRHLVLPGLRHDSLKILDWIAENTSSDEVLVSIMSQYVPFDFIPDEFFEIKRHVTKMEYNSVVKHSAELKLNGFTQQKSSASEDFVPEFDLSGII